MKTLNRISHITFNMSNECRRDCSASKSCQTTPNTKTNSKSEERIWRLLNETVVDKLQKNTKHRPLAQRVLLANLARRAAQQQVSAAATSNGLERKGCVVTATKQQQPNEKPPMRRAQKAPHSKWRGCASNPFVIVDTVTSSNSSNAEIATGQIVRQVPPPRVLPKSASGAKGRKMSKKQRQKAERASMREQFIVLNDTPKPPCRRSNQATNLLSRAQEEHTASRGSKLYDLLRAELSALHRDHCYLEKEEEEGCHDLALLDSAAAAAPASAEGFASLDHVGALATDLAKRLHF